MKKIFSFIIAVGVMISLIFVSGMVSERTYATPCASNTFLGMKAWYDGLECGSDGKSPQPSAKSEDAMKDFVWTIVGNVAFDLLLIVGIIATGYVIYAGYVYLTAGGDPGKAAKARKSLIASVSGILISIAASSIIDLLLKTTISNNFKNNDPSSALKGMFDLAMSFGGIVATGFIILGGITYMTSGGNPGKVSKAKQILLYSVIGLAVVVTAYAIVNLVIGSAS